MQVSTGMQASTAMQASTGMQVSAGMQATGMQVSPAMQGLACARAPAQLGVVSSCGPPVSSSALAQPPQQLAHAAGSMQGATVRVTPATSGPCQVPAALAKTAAPAALPGAPAARWTIEAGLLEMVKAFAAGVPQAPGHAAPAAASPPGAKAAAQAQQPRQLAGSPAQSHKVPAAQGAPAAPDKAIFMQGMMTARNAILQALSASTARAGGGAAAGPAALTAGSSAPLQHQQTGRAAQSNSPSASPARPVNLPAQQGQGQVGGNSSTQQWHNPPSMSCGLAYSSAGMPPAGSSAPVAPFPAAAVPAATTAMLQQLVSAVAASCAPQSAPQQGPHSNLPSGPHGSPAHGFAAASPRTGQQQTGGIGPLQQAGFRQGPQGSAQRADLAGNQECPGSGQPAGFRKGGQGPAQQPAGLRQGLQGSAQPAAPAGTQQGQGSGTTSSPAVSGPVAAATATLLSAAAAGGSGGIDYSAALAAAAAAVFGELQSNKKQRRG
jgi:hypothetical protein